MARAWPIVAGVAAAVAIAAGIAVHADRPEPAAVDVAPTKKPIASQNRPGAPNWQRGGWQAPAGATQVPIWPGRAPDEPAARTPERLKIAATPEALAGGTSVAAYDVSTPTMTVFPPKGRSTGAAIVVFPGGGFKAVVLTLQGTEVCGWLTARGITCIVAKYRVPDTEHHWDNSCDCGVAPAVPRALQDAQRTIRLVRARAGALKVDPARIGAMGFSAGGYLVVKASNVVTAAYRPVDAADRISSRPDFAIALYPGHLCRPGGILDPAIRVTRRTPPTFLLQSWDDPVDPVCNSTLYARALDAAGVPAEVHLFARGGHAFALRRQRHPIAVWPRLVERWLDEIGATRPAR